MLVEAGNVFTRELHLVVPNRGIMSLEDGGGISAIRRLNCVCYVMRDNRSHITHHVTLAGGIEGHVAAFGGPEDGVDFLDFFH